MTTAHFFDKAGNTIAPSITDAGALTGRPADLWNDQIYMVQNTTTLQIGTLTPTFFAFTKTLALPRRAYGICLQRSFGNQDPSNPGTVEKAYFTTQNAS